MLIETPRFDSPYGKIRCLVRATGAAHPSAFLIHGSGGDADVWRPVLERLTRVNAIAIDMPGHGESGGTPLASVAAAAAFLDDLRARIGIARVTVVGQSLGGAMAQQYGFDHRDTCSAIIVANSAVDFNIGPERLRAIEEDWAKTAEDYAAGQVSKRASPALREAARRMIQNRRPPVFTADLQVCNGFNSRAWAGAIQVPVLIIAGYDDTLTVPARSYALLDLIPHAEMVVYSPCGHCTMLEQPARFAAEIDAFAR